VEALKSSLAPQSHEEGSPVPGLLVGESSQPRLFKEILDAAARLGQKQPDEVYLTFEMNAAVTHRGAIFGLGGRRVMALGLPLLMVLTLPQFRAALLHEFGHFAGNDFKLGAWIYSARSSILHHLRSHTGHGAFSRFYRAWTRLFLRISGSLGRQQEMLADRLAAQAAGSRAMSQMLEIVNRPGPDMELWNNEMKFMVHAGFLPPLIESFRSYLETVPAAPPPQTPRDPFDLHPPLAERLSWVRHYPEGPVSLEDPRALDLVSNLPGIERALLSLMSFGVKVEDLKPVGWQEATEKAYLPRWRGFVLRHAPALDGLTAESIATAVKNPLLLALGSVTLRREERGLSGEDVRSFCVNLLGAALVLALKGRGWSLLNPPGASIKMALEGKELLPFDEIRGIIDNRTTVEDWHQRCRNLGIAGLELTPVPPS
jgi:Zn-dependent protease with chaperone function